MSISLTSFLTEISNRQKPLSAGILAYFRERQRNKLYDVVIKSFLEKEAEGILTRDDLARHLGKDPAQISKWLSTPSNWTLDTISDLVLGISGGELNFSISSIKDMPQRNS